jgi:hypothetical protein
MSMDSPKTRLIALCFLSHIFLYAEGLNLMEETIKQSAQKLLKPEQEKKREAATEPHIYYLSSIVYCDNDHWTIWLNDEQIVPVQKEHLSVDISVKSDSVSIKHKDTSDCLYLLRPHQTINLKTGAIYSGDQREKLEKEEQKLHPTEGEDFDF